MQCFWCSVWGVGYRVSGLGFVLGFALGCLEREAHLHVPWEHVVARKEERRQTKDECRILKRYTTDEQRTIWSDP